MHELQKGMAWLMDDRHMLAGLAIGFGRAQKALTACRNYNENTLFDLASLTKMFTILSLLKLRDKGLLSLSDPLQKWDKRFANLPDTTLFDLCTFAQRLVTPGRIDDAPDRQTALERLFAASRQPHTRGRVYSDIHAMVLKYVIEAASGQSYFDYLTQWLLKPLGLNSLTAAVAPEKRPLCASCDNEHRIEGESYICRRGVAPGTVHDPKARRLSLDGSDLCGHAGLFGSLKDLIALCQALLQGDVLAPDTLREMAVNRTGKPLNWGYSQYLGYQCFVKHPDQHHSEAPPYMGDAAISWSGFTGHHLSLDIDRGLFCVILGNRVENRLTVLAPPPGKTLADYGLAPDGSGLFTWPDGEKVFSSVNYVYQKDARLHGPIGQMLALW
ncbi:MAG: beta-lactamase family protein [Clostridia bacterium]|nr:beta-lactamase family protein [Clostridia bacterium]